MRYDWLAQSHDRTRNQYSVKTRLVGHGDTKFCNITTASCYNRYRFYKRSTDINIKSQFKTLQLQYFVVYKSLKQNEW